MTLTVSLTLLLLSAHSLGWFAERMGQPALIGQMLAGILVGPSLIGILETGSALGAVVDLAVLFVVITAGLEMRMQNVLETLRGAGCVGLLASLVIPAAAAAALCYVLGLQLMQGTVVVLCVSVTALPVALRILAAFELLHTRVACVAIACALLSDVVVLMGLGLAIGAHTTGGIHSLLVSAAGAAGKLMVLFGLVAVGHYVCLRLSARKCKAASGHSQESAVDGVSIVTLLFIVAFGTASEMLGFPFIVGSFMAALMVTPDLIGGARFATIEKAFQTTTTSLFAPLFLAYQGVQLDVASMGAPGMLISVISVAIVSKMLGGYIAGRMQALSRYAALGVALIVNARGLMELVVANVAYRAGLVDKSTFSALIVLGMVTTVVTPLLLRVWMRNERRAKVMVGIPAATERSGPA